MLEFKLQVTMLIGIGLYFALLIYLLRKKSLNLKYTLLWLFSGIVMLVFALAPKLLTLTAKFLGIYEPTNALFAIMSFCVIIILVSLTSIVSKLNERVKRLAQTIALLDEEVRRSRKEIQRENSTSLPVEHGFDGNGTNAL